jgi:hypothetical protein
VGVNAYKARAKICFKFLRGCLGLLHKLHRGAAPQKNWSLWSVSLGALTTPLFFSRTELLGTNFRGTRRRGTNGPQRLKLSGRLKGVTAVPSDPQDRFRFARPLGHRFRSSDPLGTGFASPDPKEGSSVPPDPEGARSPSDGGTGPQNLEPMVKPLIPDGNGHALTRPIVMTCHAWGPTSPTAPGMTERGATTSRRRPHVAPATNRTTT